jgi:hypothetical protein
VSARATSTDELPGVPGDYHGRATRRLQNAHCWLEVLSVGGPRVVGFGLLGAANILAETPQVSWDAGHGSFELMGGHRLWFAPETPDCSVPDSTGLTLASIPGADGSGVRLVGAVQAPTGLRKTVEIRLDPESAAVTLRHVIVNEGSRTLELSPWPITQLRPGGVAVVPLPAAVKDHGVEPNQVLVLWPYASWSDKRLTIGERYLTVAAHPAPPFKVGCLSLNGVAGYLREGELFVKRFDPALDSAHADFGCNVEIYCDEAVIEVESLGALVRLGPGDATTHVERWELHDVGQGMDAAGVAALL